MKDEGIPEAGTAQTLIEAALPEDAEELRSIQVKTWYATYVNADHAVIIEGLRRRQEGTNGEVSEQRISFWRSRIETAGSGHAVLMARASGQAAGFAAPSFMGSQWRVGALYVRPGAQRRNAGSKLLQTAL